MNPHRDANEHVPSLPTYQSKNVLAEGGLEAAIEFGLVARVIENSTVPKAAAKLRHDVFAESLGWVAQSPQKEEMDRCDPHATHFIVLKGENVAGYCRLLPGGDIKFMLEQEFAELDPSKCCVNDLRAAEVSRICTAPSMTGGDRSRVALMLYKISYRWAIRHNLVLWHVVVTERYFAALRKIGFPFRVVYCSTTFDPDCRTYYATLCLKEAQIVLKRRNALLYEWITGDQSHSYEGGIT